MTDPDAADAARAYAARGWPVLLVWGIADDGLCRCGDPECGSPGKHPHSLAPHGLHDATTDPAHIAELLSLDSTANIALATGVGCDVLDVDQDDFVTGVSDLPDCETDGGPVVLTGAGRFHLYFAPTGIGRRIKFSEHCDWLGLGGYVIAPPSRHVRGGTYRWFAPSDLPLTRPPSELLDVLRPPVHSSLPPRPLQPPRAPGGWSPNGLYGRMAAAVEGERNPVLYWCASRIRDDVRAGRVSDTSADDALGRLGDLAERSGLKRRAVEATIRSALHRVGE